MRTPAGVECRYFYGDYYRGRKREECRLLAQNPQPQQWSPDLCRTCPVPGILRANACPHLVLQASIGRTMLGLKRHVKVDAYCVLSNSVVSEPQIGCGICHPLPPILAGADDGIDPSG
jgi:hypothetical protein